MKKIKLIPNNFNAENIFYIKPIFKKFDDIDLF